MATKINESVWGTVPSTGYAIRVAPNSLGTCYNNGTFDPDNISAMDKTIVPWGVPYCGIGGMSYLKKLRMPIPIEGTGNMKAGTLTTFEIEEFIETNNPIALMMTGNINSTTKQNWFSHRMSSAVNSSETSFTSNAAWDRDTNIPAGSQYMWNFRPVVYLDYQNVLVQVNAFVLWDKNAGTRIVASNINNYPASGKTWDDYELLGFNYVIYYRGANNTWTPNNYYTSIPINTKDTSSYVLDRYFGQEIRPQKWTPYTYSNAIRTTFYGSSGSYQITTTAITAEADSESLNSKAGWTGELHSYGNYINGSHSFDNIAYSMEKKCGFMSGGTWFEIVKGSELPGSDFYSANIQMGVYYKIKDYEPGTSKASAWAKIIAHEIAFLGLPFQIKISGDSGTPAATASIADDDVFLPIFDINHMVTTGRYTTDIAVKQAQANYTWGDIFDNSVPNWDSTYNPPKPSGGDESEEDFGNLINRGGFNKFPTPLTCYMLSYEKFMDVVTALNDLYITDPDGNTKWELDFKGSNPSDYIVGAYASVCNIPYSSDTYPIKIGPVDLSTIQPTLTTYKISFVDSGYFDCGSVDITPYYDDFRDYAPYTSIELYLPLCGTVDIDTAYFMGHSLSITYYYDYTTMSCSACIYRDGITLYKVVNGSIGAQIPLTSLRMGEYQSAIHALENAEKQNEMRMASALVSMGISAAGIIAAPATGGTTLGLAALGLNGVKTGMDVLNTHNDLQYQYEHKQPAIAQTGASDSQNAFCVGSMYPYLFIKRPKMIPGYNSDVYAHTIGYACNVNARIGDMSGYTVATNIDTSGIHATADEINAIKQAFSKGVYL